MGREKFEINWRKIVIVPHHTEIENLYAPPFHCRSSICIISSAVFHKVGGGKKESKKEWNHKILWGLMRFAERCDNF
jgi:hypothetical protein